MEKKALAAKASVLLRPASSRKSVLTPQMKRRRQRGEQGQEQVDTLDLRGG